MAIDPEPILRALLEAARAILPADVQVTVSGHGRGTLVKLQRPSSNGLRFRVLSFPFGVGTWLPLSSARKYRLAVADAAETLQDALSDLSGDSWPADGVNVVVKRLAEGVEVWFAAPDGTRLAVTRLP